MMTASEPAKLEHPGVQDQYCSTREASVMMGVSLRTAQLMVEQGVLQAWKTSGGHRRILLESVRQYLRERGAAPSSPSEELSLLVAEDDAILRTAYSQMLANWNLPIRIRLADNGFEALLMIGRDPPDILITDLAMPKLDGFEMIRQLRENPDYDGMDIIAVTGLEDAEIAMRGGLPLDVTRLAKPVPFNELRGYVQARLVDRRRGRIPR